MAKGRTLQLDMETVWTCEKGKVISLQHRSIWSDFDSSATCFPGHAGVGEAGKSQSGRIHFHQIAPYCAKFFTGLSINSSDIERFHSFYSRSFSQSVDKNVEFTIWAPYDVTESSATSTFILQP